jgi:hypothetical protein
MVNHYLTLTLNLSKKSPGDSQVRLHSLAILMVGADVTDYFNYGFDEFTWTAYCSKQTNLRNEFNPAKIMGVLSLKEGLVIVDDDRDASRDASDDGTIPDDTRNDVWRNGNDATGSKCIRTARWIQQRRISTPSGTNGRATEFRRSIRRVSTTTATRIWTATVWRTASATAAATTPQVSGTANGFAC